MTFFYPHIDFAQNVHEGMPAVYFPADASRPARLVWTFDRSWKSSQRYLDRTNLVETRLIHRPTDLHLLVIDTVHPEEPVLIRRFEVSNPTGAPLHAKLFQYLDLQLGEMELKNAVHYHPERNVAAAYWRNICFAVGGSTFDEYGSGRASPGSLNAAKLQMAEGRLNRQLEEIGDIDMAVGWHVAVGPGQRVTRDLIVAADSNEIAAVARVEGIQDLGWEANARWSRTRWQEHVARAHAPRIERDLADLYYRCLLVIDLLADPDTGSILAAPEFDPFFERSGGYGYCWPRDAVDICLAMEAAGYPEYLGRFLSWARAAQRPEGYWEQRYWLSGQRGPAWCTKEDSLQLDQTASVLFAMGRHARSLDDPDRFAFLEEVWDCAHRAADFLARSISPKSGLHTSAFDLWETFRGTFTYSNAAISAALLEAAFLARRSGQETAADRWESTAASLKEAVLTRLWQGDGFARGLDEHGKLDADADASALGLIAPFEFLRLDDPKEREIAVALVEGLVRRLGRPSDGAETLLRFEGDTYAGGGPGALTTIWLGRVLLQLALTCRDDPQAMAKYRSRAVACMRAVLGAGTPTGLLPEMMGRGPGSHWAVPHAWTMASFVMACLLLDQLPHDRTQPPGGE
jgi:oligosaccharide amylase